MKEISTQRLILREVKETDPNDLFEFLLQLKDNEFESYPDITYENCKKHLDERVGSNEYYAVALKDGGKAGFAREAHLKQNIYFHKTADGRPVCKDTYIYAVTE